MIGKACCHGSEPSSIFERGELDHDEDCINKRTDEMIVSHFKEEYLAKGIQIRNDQV